MKLPPLHLEPQNAVMAVLGCLVVIALLANAAVAGSREQLLLALVILAVVLAVTARSAINAGSREAERRAKRDARPAPASKRRRKR